MVADKNNAVGGEFFLLDPDETGESGVMAVFEFQVDFDNDPFSDESRACWEFAKSIGIGDVWTKFLYDEANKPPHAKGNLPHAEVFNLDNHQIEILNRYLEQFNGHSETS